MKTLQDVIQVHNIDTGDNNPIFQKLYKRLIHYDLAITAEIEKLKEKGLIIKSESPRGPKLPLSEGRIVRQEYARTFGYQTVFARRFAIKCKISKMVQTYFRCLNISRHQMPLVVIIKSLSRKEANNNPSSPWIGCDISPRECLLG